MTKRLLAIAGPTASGKTALAIALAERLAARFEAVNADSRQVYRYMDIGTAKPTPAERQALTHHLLDVADPDEPFSLGRWLALGKEALTAIWRRGNLPILVGGTGQYVWALLEGWRVPEVPPQEDLRRQMESRPPDELLAELRRVDPHAHEFIQPRNVRRLIRALEVYQATGKPFSYWRTKEPPPFESLVLGPKVPRKDLYERIDRRIDAMMEAGFLDEVRALVGRGYGCDLPAMSGIGYHDLCRHLAGEIRLQEAIVRTKTGTHRLARHQNAWFKPADERIRWVDNADEASAIVEDWFRSGTDARHPTDPQEEKGD